MIVSVVVLALRVAEAVAAILAQVDVVMVVLVIVEENVMEHVVVLVDMDALEAVRAEIFSQYINEKE